MGCLLLLFLKGDYMRYKINDDQVLDDIEEVIECCIDCDYHKDDDYFEEWVNDNYDHVEINGETYMPYDIVSNLDYSNLRDMQENYCTEENENDEENARFELTHGRIGSVVWIQGNEVLIMDDEYENEEVDSEDSMTALRVRLAQNKAILEQDIQEMKKNELDLLQIIGGYYGILYILYA